MALPFMKNRATPPSMSAGKGFPSERVGELSAKGFPEGEIIDVLRKEGYGPEEIDRAMTQVLKLGVTGGGQNMSQGPSEQQQYSSEEYVDFLVRERVGEVDHKINEFMVKHAELEKRLAEVNNQMTALVQTRTSEEQMILSKLDSFKDVMNDVTIRMGSLEKAFKETLPALIESVRALSDLVQRMKREG